MQKVMEEATNGMGFDLIVMFISDEAQNPFRDSIQVLSLLGTFIVV